MKLKKVNRKTVEKKDFEDWQHCCKYCRNYENHCCTLKQNGENNNYIVSENGLLDEALEESLNSVSSSYSFYDLEMLLLSFGLSKKKVSQFNDKLKECLEDYKMRLKETLDEDISILYNNHENTGNLYINEPESYVCSDWR